MQRTMTSRTLVYLALAALLVRSVYFLQHTESPVFGRPLLDQHYYDLCARQLAGAGSGMIDGFRPLLYPLFASLFYRIDPDSGTLLTLVAQHLLGVGMVVLVAVLAARLFNSARAGIAAGLLFCFGAPPLYFEGELLIATLFSFLLLLLWFAIHAASECGSARRSAALWLLGGAILGLAAQARPNALPLVAVFPAIALFRLLQGGPSKKTALPPLLAILAVLAVQTLFGAVNARYSGTFCLVTRAGGINLYLGNSQKADGMIPRQSMHAVYEGEYRDPIQVMAEQEYRTATGAKGPVSQKEVSGYWTKRTIEEIKANPQRWIRLMIKKTWLMLWTHEVPNNASMSFQASHETPLLRWLPVHWWLLLALAPWGLAALARLGKREALAWVVVFIVVFSGTIILFFVNSRFRTPLWPGLSVLGGGGAAYLWSSLSTRRVPFIPAACSAVVLLLSGVDWFGIPADPIENDLSMRAIAYKDTGNYRRALENIEACIGIAPNNPRYRFEKGNIEMAMGENPAAIQDYLGAIALDPGDPMFHNNLGVAFENMGETDKAIMAYRKALSIRPGHRAAQVNLLLLLIQLNHLDAAQSIMGQIPAEQRNAALQCTASVLSYKRTGDIDALNRAKEANPALAEHLCPETRPQQTRP